MEKVEEERGERYLAPRAVDVEPLAESAHGGLEGARSAVPTQGNDLAIEDQLAGRQRSYQLHYLRHRRRHVVEPARVDGDLVSTLVDLDSCPVQLVLQRGLTQLPDCFGRILGRAREHRLNWPKELGGKPRQLGAASGQRSLRHTRQIPSHHSGPSHAVSRHARSLRDCLEHYPLDRTLSELACHQPEEEILLRVRRPDQQLSQEPVPFTRRALPGGYSGDTIEGGIDFGELQACRLGG